jgi:hypothetical protein
MRLARLTLMWACVSASSVTIADIYKWVDQDGKVHYGDRASGDQPATKVAVPKAGAAGVESARSRAHADCPTSDCSKAITNEVRTNPLPSGKRNQPPRASPTTGIASDSTQKAIADCKASRGVDCDKPAVNNQWVRQNTPATQQEVQLAVAERNRRKADEAFPRQLDRSRDIEGLRNQGR